MSMKPQFAHKGEAHALAIACSSLLAGFAVALLCIERWLMDGWRYLSFDELRFYLSSSLGGTNPAVVWDGILHSVVPGLIVAAALLALAWHLRQDEAYHSLFLAATIAPALLIIVLSFADLDDQLDLRHNLLASAEPPHKSR